MFLDLEDLNKMSIWDFEEDNAIAIEEKLYWREEYPKVKLSVKEFHEECKNEFPVRNPENGITDEMIEQARNYPFEDLIEINKKGFAICPYHEEDTPSFSIDKVGNYGHCFGCDKTVDAIQYIMDREKLQFMDAIKYLNSD